MKFKKDEAVSYDLGQMPGKPIDITPPSMPVQKTWQPKGETHTMIYGQGSPTPSLSTKEIAAQEVAQYYPYLLKGSPEYNRRLKEFIHK